MNLFKNIFGSNLGPSSRKNMAW